MTPELVDGNGSFGSVVYHFAANSEANVFGASMVQRNNSPVGFHFDAESIEKGWSPATTESVWWLPRATATDDLILGNASGEPLTTSVALSDAAGHAVTHTVSIGPARAVRLDMRALTSAAGLAGSHGGVSVSTAANAGALLAAHIVFNVTAGISATMKTFERDPSERPTMYTLRAPMMALSTPDPVLLFPLNTVLNPQLFLRNASAVPLAASVALNWRAESGVTGRIRLPDVNLAPGETRTLDLMSATAAVQLPRDVYWATVAVRYQGRYGDLVPVATSFDTTGRYGLQTPFSDTLAALWKGSMWHAAVGRNSLITAGNGGSQPARAALALFYNGGKSSYTLEKLLQPDELLWADIGELIRDQIPDKDGRVIPANVMMGSYEVRDLDHRAAGTLFEGKLVLDKTLGHGYYGCAGCCGDLTPTLNPNPFSWGR